ncbi:tyrosine-protein phosphatase non-receptor type 4-like isoform X1 [Apostichopus japonicus]
MSRKQRTTSGSYNVRANELARERLEKKIRCLIIFLDDSEHCFEIERRARGQELLLKVFEHLDLVESDYFGLKIVEGEGSLETQRQWLDPRKSIRKQLKGSAFFLFQVKFFVSEPEKLLEDYTRYQYVLQLKKDILEDRLQCTFNVGTKLASYLVQGRLGDFDAQEHLCGYLDSYVFVPNQTEEFTKEVVRLHKSNCGLLPSEAELEYLNLARDLEMYGIDLHLARDQHAIEIQVGVTSLGLIIFQGLVKIKLFPWASIVKISFKRKQFFLQQKREQKDTRDLVIGFNMASYRACKNLWKSCVEHHTFFRLVEPQQPAGKRNFFQLGSKFRYSGRTEVQTVEDTKKRLAEREFSRSPSKRIFRRTIGGSSSDVIRNETRSLPSRGSNHSNVTKNSRKSKLGNSEGPTTNSFNGIQRENGFSRSEEILTTAHFMYVDDGGSDNSLVEKTYDLQTNGIQLPNGVAADSLIVIRMRPNDKGQFGFSVKGGCDQGAPVIVCRVAPNTPADLCIPRLNEGDQILLLNGQDISTYTNEEVVSAIRGICELQRTDLVLTVRPNVYVSDDVEEEEEPVFQYIPESPRVANGGIDPLSESIMLLQEGLASGTALAQFEQLYRRKSGMTMNECKEPENIAKNRYRDISPYDATRVILTDSDTGDYINANVVNMDIPKAAMVNKYIAAQGPLPNTMVDFWDMIWEQRSTLIVMLTTNVERGRVKCHKYWPNVNQNLQLSPAYDIKCIREEDANSFAFRDFHVRNLKSNEERVVQQMQYIAWPDHGVPDDSSDFLDFVLRVRQRRINMEVPTIVHCSAGIGRTGVLVTMETAMCLIETNDPIYPLDIVRRMRDQRAMLIQTTAQYKFVCEAIIRVYMDGIVQPLDEYKL